MPQPTPMPPNGCSEPAAERLPVPPVAVRFLLRSTMLTPAPSSAVALVATAATASVTAAKQVFMMVELVKKRAIESGRKSQNEKAIGQPTSVSVANAVVVRGDWRSLGRWSRHSAGLLKQILLAASAKRSWLVARHRTDLISCLRLESAITRVDDGPSTFAATTRPRQTHRSPQAAEISGWDGMGEGTQSCQTGLHNRLANMIPASTTVVASSNADHYHLLDRPVALVLIACAH